MTDPEHRGVNLSSPHSSPRFATHTDTLPSILVFHRSWSANNVPIFCACSRLGSSLGKEMGNGNDDFCNQYNTIQYNSSVCVPVCCTFYTTIIACFVVVVVDKTKKATHASTPTRIINSSRRGNSDRPFRSSVPR
mmetsp:Transcript_19158/g.39458  ORF Transcript_19158/g.39458 Transcript_19158/m.39458 type:complete len:135 (+) Transcript_19158:218-622(+)